MKHKYSLLTHTLCTVLLALLTLGAWGQLAPRYSLATTSGTYSSISATGTSLSTIVADDAAINITGLSPGFTVNGTTYTNARMCSNGWLILYATTAPTSTGLYATALSTATTNAAVIFAPFNADLITSTAATTAAYRQTIGNEHIFEWVNYSRTTSGFSSGSDVLNFQLRLNTATGAVQFVYGNCTAGNFTPYTASPQVGWKTNGTTAANWSTDINNLMIDVTGSPNTCDWSNAVTGNANNSSMYFLTTNATVKPNSGLTYTWTPIANPLPVRTFSAVSSITSSGATINFTAPTGATQYNVRYRVAGTCGWTDASGNPYATTSAAITGLAPLTTYQVQVQASNGTTSAIYSHIPNQAGSGNGYVAAGTFTTLAAACSGTPAASTTVSSAASVCSGVNFTLSLGTSYSGLTGITYQWQSADDAGFTTNLTNLGTAATQITSQTASKYYRCLITCTNGGASVYSSALQVTMAPLSNCYCAPTYTNPCTSGDVIASFSTTGGSTNITNNNSGCNGGTSNYMYYSGQTLTATQGNSINLSIVCGSGTLVNQGFSIWIDYNQNGLFTDAGELVWSSPNATNTSATPYTGSFTIPLGATAGTTRMRVRSQYNTIPASPCANYGYGETEDYNVTIATAVPCTGAPAASTTNSSVASACNGVNFTLSLGTTYTQSGITYQWQSADDAGFTVNVANLGTSSTQVTSQSAAKYYRCRVTCSNSGQTITSTPVQVGLALCYCSAGATSTTFEKISNVTFNTINNNSTATAGYEDFTAVSTTVYRGSSYSFSASYTGTTYSTDQVFVWIDFNQNGVFTDLGELVVFASGTSPWTGSITIPTNAVGGNTRMRVRLMDSDPTDILNTPNATPCGNSSYGQVEDYTINIQTQACSGTPTAGTLPATLGICSGSTTVLSPTGGQFASGLTYQWEQQSGSWSNATGGSGATTSSYTTPAINASTTYRLTVTCTASGLSASTNAITVAPVSIDAGPDQTSCTNPTATLAGVYTQPLTVPLLSEKFNDISTLSGAGWAQINNSSPLGGTGWFQGVPNVFTANSAPSYSYIGANYNNTGTTGTISNWLLTPPVLLKNGTTLTFYTRSPGSGYADRLEVRMSTNNTSTNVGSTATSVGDFTTVLLTINPTLAGTGYPSTWTQYTVTVSGLGAPVTGRIGFRYYVTSGGSNGANSDFIGIDDVVITSNPTYSWSGPGIVSGGNTLTPTVNASGTYTVTVNDGSCTATDNVSISLGACDYVWNGSTSTDWNTATNWTPNGVPNACAYNVTVPLVANQPNISGADFSVGNIDVSNGVIITVQNGRKLNVCRDMTSGTGSGAQVNGGTLTFMGSTGQNLSGIVNADHLVLNNTSGLTISNAATSVYARQSVDLLAGTLTTNSNLTLLSNASGTAYLNDFTGTGTASGTIHVQRYNPLGATGYRQLGTPVAMPSISGVAGFTVSGVPGFVIPLSSCNPNYVASNSPYGSWVQLVENASPQYNCAQSLFQVLTSGGMTNGRGYYMDAAGGSTFTFTGTPNTGTISFGLTHANPTISHGWNMVSNPYPSPLQWEMVNVPSGVDAIGKIWVTSGAYTGTWQDLDPSAAGIQAVAIGQAFQVRVTTPGTTPPFLVDNSDRTISPPTHLFAGNDPMTLNIEILGNGFADLTKVRFMDGATASLDAMYDSPKMLGNANQPMIYSIWDGKDYSTNSYGELNQVYALPLGIKVAANGQYTFSFSNVDQFPASALIYLEDVQTGTVQDVRANDTYVFTQTAGTITDRFILHFYPPVEKNVTASTCTTLGQVTLTEESPAAWAYSVANAQGSVVNQGILDASQTITGLAVGNYTLTLTHQTSGYVAMETFAITGAQQVTAMAQASVSTVEVGQEIQFTANTTNATAWSWNFGDGNTSTEQNPLHAYNAAGQYIATLIATNGSCEQTAQVSVSTYSTASIGDNLENLGIKMWNSNNTVYITFKDTWAGKTTFTLYDMNGKKVFQQNLNNAIGTQLIDCGILAPGTYTVEIKNNDKSASRKVVMGIK